MDSYAITEDSSSLSICAELIRGEAAISVSVTLSSSHDGSAQGIYGLSSKVIVLFKLSCGFPQPMSTLSLCLPPPSLSLGPVESNVLVSQL